MTTFYVRRKNNVLRQRVSPLALIIMFLDDRFLGFPEEGKKKSNRPVQLMTTNTIRNPHLKRSIDRDSIVIYE